MTAAALHERTFLDVVVGEPLALAKSQPHQILLSAGSVALMGQFASTDNIVHPFVGYAIAIGVEWAYLRGLASDSRAQTAWGGVLNWSAFGIVALWGVLWCAGILGVFDPSHGGWLLAAAHVLPVAWLSLCSAQCHRAAMAAERRGAARDDDARRAWELAQEEEDRKLERWKDAQRLKAELKIAEKTADAAMPVALLPVASQAFVPATKGKTAYCAKCKKQVAWATPSEAGTIKRWGCAACRAAKDEA